MPRPAVPRVRCVCATCETPFDVPERRAAVARYCSHACRAAAQHAERVTVTRVCDWCERRFEVKPSVVERGGGRFCSTLCYHLSRRRTN